MPEEPALAARIVRGIMPTIWGQLEKVDTLSAPAPNIEVRTLLSDGTVLRVRTKIGPETLIARGIGRVMCRTYARASLRKCPIGMVMEDGWMLTQSTFDRSRPP